MPRFRTAATLGVQMEDGTEYRPNKHNIVEIDRPDHADAAKRQGSIYGVLEPVRTGFSDTEVPGIECPRPGCFFNAFAFSKVCPKCGTTLRPKEEE